MAPFRSFPRFASRVVAALCLAAAASAAWEVPAGTAIGVRLKTKVADATAKPKDAVEAEVIAPVVVDGRFLVPAGAAVHGAVESAKPATKPDERAALLLDFTGIEIGGQTLKLAAKVAAVVMPARRW